MAKIVLVLFYLLFPAAVLWACRKNKILGKLGPVLTLYILGVVVANLHIVPEDCRGIQKTLQDVMIPLAIPMMLFGCNFKNFKAGVTAKAFIIGTLSTVAMVLLSYWLLAGNLGADGPTVGATLSGQYTGGAGNFAAVNMMLGDSGLSEEKFALVSTCNLIVSFFYLMFLMGGGVKLARKFVGKKEGMEQNVNIEEYTDENPYKEFGKKKSIIQLGKVLLSSVIVMGISVCIGTYAGGGKISMVALILSITTLSLLLTSWKEVRTWDKSYDAGMYLIYIFCLVMATMADLSSINWEQSLYILLYQAIIIFGSLFLTVLFAKIFRIDADTAVITSDTLINSPICVPMIAATMKNKDVIVTGITNGLMGYAIGNYIGFLMFHLFELF